MALVFFDAPPPPHPVFALARSQNWDAVFSLLTQDSSLINLRDTSVVNAPTLLDIAQGQQHYRAINGLLIEFQALTGEQAEGASKQAMEYYRSLTTTPHLAVTLAASENWQFVWTLINTGSVNLNIIYNNETLLDIAHRNAPDYVLHLQQLGAKTFKELMPVPAPVKAPSTRWADIVEQEEDDEHQPLSREYTPQHESSKKASGKKYVVPPRLKHKDSADAQQPQGPVGKFSILKKK